MSECKRCGAKFEGEPKECPSCRSLIWKSPILQFRCRKCGRKFKAKGLKPPNTCPFPDCRSPRWNRKKMTREERRAAVLEGIRLKKMGMVVVKKRAGEDIKPGQLVALKRGRAVPASGPQDRIIGVAMAPSLAGKVEARLGRRRRR